MRNTLDRSEVSDPVSLPHLSCLDRVADAKSLGSPLPGFVLNRLDWLGERIKADLLGNLEDLLIATDGGGHLGLIFGAAFKRTMSLQESFSHAVERRNGQAALVLLRAHLDTAMRIHGLWLASDRNSYVESVLGGNVRSFKSRDGRSLTDAVLHQALSERYEGLSDDYKTLSGLVHFSTFSMVSPHEKNEDGDLGLRLDHNDWPSAAACAATIAFALYAAALIQMSSIVVLAARGSVLDGVFESGQEAFSVVPLPAWINIVRCGCEYAGPLSNNGIERTAQALE